MTKGLWYQMKNMTKPMAIVVSPLLTPLYPFTMNVMVKKIVTTLKKESKTLFIHGTPCCKIWKKKNLVLRIFFN